MERAVLSMVEISPLCFCKTIYFWFIRELEQEERNGIGKVPLLFRNGIGKVPLLFIKYELSHQVGSRYSLNEELKAKWDRLWHFFSISQQFGVWDVEMKNASEKECNLIMKTQEILSKYGVVENPELLKDVFNSLSEREINTCLEGLEVILKYMKYHAGFKLNRRDSQRG